MVDSDYRLHDGQPSGRQVQIGPAHAEALAAPHDCRGQHDEGSIEPMLRGGRLAVRRRSMTPIIGRAVAAARGGSAASAGFRVIRPPRRIPECGAWTAAMISLIALSASRLVL